jgi:hypothetical protein
MKIDVTFLEYKILQSKIKKNMVVPKYGLHQKIRTIL